MSVKPFDMFLRVSNNLCDGWCKLGKELAEIVCYVPIIFKRRWSFSRKGGEKTRYRYICICIEFINWDTFRI